MISRLLLVALAALILTGAGPATRVIALPGRPGVPAHFVRVRLWLPDGAGPSALLLYQPGWNGSADENSILLADLAKAGFGVAAMDLATLQPPGFSNIAAHLDRPMDLSSFPAMAETVAEADWRAVLLAGDAAAALDQLASAEPPVAAGILGYSFGGAVAAEVCREDARFAACLNLDGWMFGPAAEHPGRQPYLLISGDPYPAAASDATSPAGQLDAEDGARLRARMAAVGGLYAEILGLRHEDFTDRHGDNEAVASLARAFFSRTLLGRPEPMLDLAHPLPGVTLNHFAPALGD